MQEPDDVGERLQLSAVVGLDAAQLLRFLLGGAERTVGLAAPPLRLPEAQLALGPLGRELRLQARALRPQRMELPGAAVLEGCGLLLAAFELAVVPPGLTLQPRHPLLGRP